MFKLSILCLFLFVALAYANLKCDLCKLFVNGVEGDVAGNKDFKNKISKHLLDECINISDAKAKKTCQTMFSKDNIGLVMSAVADSVGLSAEEICEGIGSC
ncbi:hypothetical protein M3Y97_00212300 [Aphelenchoides bicaudatus]|nr:hypothetical protein M3Y97_00212300 [Aphelenchoides bicaudatus]